MIPVIGLLIGVIVGIVLDPTVPLWVQPYLPIAVIAALDAVFGAIRANQENNFDDRIFITSFLSNIAIAALIVFRRSAWCWFSAFNRCSSRTSYANIC